MHISAKTTQVVVLPWRYDMEMGTQRNTASIMKGLVFSYYKAITRQLKAFKISLNVLNRINEVQVL